MPTEPVELLIANILSGPLVALAETFAQLVKPNGIIVLSGILEEQTKHIVTAYQTYFSAIQVAQKGDWIRVTAQRNQ